MNATRVSLSDIARVVGCSVATISLALNGDERVRASTRQAVAKAAKELGYVPHPLLASLARKRFKSASLVASTPVAFVTKNEAWKFVEDICEREILAKAPAHGLDVVRYSLKDLAHLKRPDRILYNRGTEGIFLSPFVQIDELGDFDWAKFSVVGMNADLEAGSASSNSFVHRVGPDYFWGGHRCWLEARKAGYRRIGFVFEDHQQVIGDDVHRIASAALAFQLTPEVDRVPLFSMPFPAHPEDLAQWVQQHRPEVVIGHNETIAQKLKDAGFKIPGQIAFINMGAHGPGKYAGTHLGDGYEAGLDFLAALIRKRQRGLPTLPQTVLVHPVWFPGPSLPLRAKQKNTAEI